MKNHSSYPRFTAWQPLPDIAALLLAHLSIFFAARLALFYFLYPLILEKGHIARALYIGFKFDARYAVFLTLPVAVALLLPSLERKISDPSRPLARRLICGLQGFLFAIASLLYVFDFGFFFYLQERLAMTALDFVEDPLISASMIWQSYPVVPLLLALAAMVVCYCLSLGRFLKGHTVLPDHGQKSENTSGKLRRASFALVVSVGFFAIAYGQISSNLFPLRWSNAYFSGDKNISLLALHPIQNLWDTRHAGAVHPPERALVENSYARMVEWLGLKQEERDEANLSFVRHFPASTGASSESRPNVVIIIMESLAWPRTSFAPPMQDGQDLDPTPFLRELAGKSRYFSNFYAPARTTARAVFTTISGVPDVNHIGGTTSRNPVLVDQFSVFNEFQGYEKYYMLGGSASWANIRGLLQYNIEDLHLMEEGAWESPNVDVWGISDLSLFRESVDVLGKSPKPFISVIQTAGFHRPYTIPDDNEGYVRPETPSPEALRHYGFESEEEYVSMHFSDYALRRFFEHAKNQPWFENTVFAIFGDHGLTYISENVSPGYLGCQLQAWHVPLLLYSPGGLIAPGVNDNPYMQPDVLVTMASLAGIGFRTNTLGRNLLDPANDEDAVAYISASEFINVLVKDGYCFASGLQVLYDLEDTSLVNLIDVETERAADMKKQADDFFNTSRYLLFNNSKKSIQ